MINDWVYALIGGILIGVSASLMLYWDGRVTGISGILYGLIGRESGGLWGVWFLLGLVSGGFVLQRTSFGSLTVYPDSPSWTVPLAGLLVGFGTVLGSGCTSGHGVCGVSRLSVRSLIATGLFIAAGVVSVFILKACGVFP